MDMLVALYRADFPVEEDIRRLAAEGISIRRAHPVNLGVLQEYVETAFSAGWKWEVTHCFSHPSPTCYIAVKDKKIIGFAAYEATAPDFFGPIGVSAEYRRKGIGTVLSRLCFRSMKEMGYGYAIIGWAAQSARHFYRTQFGAVDIADSEPENSVYANLIQVDADPYLPAAERSGEAAE